MLGGGRGGGIGGTLVLTGLWGGGQKPFSKLLGRGLARVAHPHPLLLRLCLLNKYPFICAHLTTSIPLDGLTPVLLVRLKMSLSTVLFPVSVRK